MATKRYKRKRTQKRTKKRRPNGKNWVTAVGAADTVLKKTGSYEKAKETLRIQALRNARRLFGSVGEML
jgi:hypothetical protein